MHCYLLPKSLAGSVGGGPWAPAVVSASVASITLIGSVSALSAHIVRVLITHIDTPLKTHKVNKTSLINSFTDLSVLKCLQYYMMWHLRYSFMRKGDVISSTINI